MKKFISFVLALFFVLVVLAIGVFFYVVVYVDDIIEKTAETIIPQMTKSHFDIEKVKTEPLDGKIEIQGLYLSNPEGYPEGHALKFDKIHVHVDLQSLRKNKIVVNAFVINGLDVVLYKEADKESNLGAILQNINEYLQELNESQEIVDIDEVKKEAEKKIKKKTPKLRFQVNLMEINNAKALVHSEKKLALKAEATIPSVKLENLGVEGKGLTVQDLVKTIIKEVIKEVDVAVSLQRVDQNGKKGDEKESEEKKGLSGKLQELLTPKPKTR